MDELSGLVPYRIVKQQLDARLKTTDDEIAMWVSGIDEGGLNAYVMDSFRKPRLFTFEPRHFINDDNYISPLEGIYFLLEDIERFQPPKRYISRKALIQRWAKPCGDKASAINFVKYRAKDSGLIEYHPIVGRVESTGDLFRNGLFDLNYVRQIEFKFFPESPDKAIETNAVVATDNTHSISVSEGNIPYTKAKRILQDKFNTTEEEIIMWIETKEIMPKDAWLKINVGGKEEEKLRWNFSALDDDELIKVLKGLYFNEDAIRCFDPEVRYLTFTTICERWSIHGETAKGVAAILLSELGVSPSNADIDNGKNLNLYV